jgi:hypothetical protein
MVWTKICRPKNQGGFGVLNLEVQTNALLLKNLQKKKKIGMTFYG